MSKSVSFFYSFLLLRASFLLPEKNIYRKWRRRWRECCCCWKMTNVHVEVETSLTFFDRKFHHRFSLRLFHARRNFQRKKYAHSHTEAQSNQSTNKGRNIIGDTRAYTFHIFQYIIILHRLIYIIKKKKNNIFFLGWIMIHVGPSITFIVCICLNVSGKIGFSPDRLQFFETESYIVSITNNVVSSHTIIWAETYTEKYDAVHIVLTKFFLYFFQFFISLSSIRWIRRLWCVR